MAMVVGKALEVTVPTTSIGVLGEADDWNQVGILKVLFCTNTAADRRASHYGSRWTLVGLLFVL